MLWYKDNDIDVVVINLLIWSNSKCWIYKSWFFPPQNFLFVFIPSTQSFFKNQNKQETFNIFFFLPKEIITNNRSGLQFMYGTVQQCVLHIEKWFLSLALDQKVKNNNEVNKVKLERYQYRHLWKIPGVFQQSSNDMTYYSEKIK